jgi:hypothetical protein
MGAPCDTLGLTTTFGSQRHMQAVNWKERRNPQKNNNNNFLNKYIYILPWMSANCRYWAFLYLQGDKFVTPLLMDKMGP